MNITLTFRTVILILAFFIAFLLESTVFRLPIILMLLLVVFAHKKSPELFALAFALGILQDIVTLQRIGLSSLFFVIFLFLTYLYERKYQIDTFPFIIIASAVGTIASAYLFKNVDLLFSQVIMSVIMSCFLFVFYQKLEQ